MSEAGASLRRVAEAFRNAGVGNDVRVAEHVAFLLLVRDQWSTIRQTNPYELTTFLNRLYEAKRSQFPNLVIPPPPTIPFGTLLRALEALETAIEVGGYRENLGTFFQREIRYELLSNSRGVQYPTPHHIADFMAELVVSSRTKTLIDPTAGTAGLLVASLELNDAIQLTGVEFDTQWASLASVNLVLNNAVNPQIDILQALNLYGRDKRYDAVLMNPPFGGSRSESEVRSTIGPKYGRTGSTVLAVLCLQLRTPLGGAAFLLPSGALIGGGGEAELRRTLLQEQPLEAVITLPSDAMQPYSQVASHLIVVHAANPGAAIWFVSLSDDGYDPGTSRVLTDEPTASRNELPRARDLILKTRNNQWEQFFEFDGTVVQTARVGSELSGLGVRLLGDAQFIKWHVIHRSDGLMVRVTDAAGALKGWFYESYAAENVPVPLRFATSDAVPLNWTEKLQRQDWATGSETWHGSSDDTTLVIDAATPTFTLNGIKFGTASEERSRAFACLIDTEGQPITPWLSDTDSKFNPEKFGKNLQTSIIQDALGQRLGWILDVTSGQGDDEKQATLFIVLASENSVYHSGNGTFYALLDNGWIEIRAEGRLQLQTGTPVRFRDDFTPQGFAVGPSPENDGAAYSLFGVLVQREILIVDGKVGDMRPSRFLPEPEAAPLGHPLDVLATIRRSQVELADKVDTLLGILGHPGQYSEEAELPAEVPTWIEAVLGSEQKQLRALLTQRLAGQKPRHFTQADLIEWCKLDLPTFAGDDVQQQMTLFVRLGLVKEVNIDGKNYYRMITRGDVAQPAGESS